MQTLVLTIIKRIKDTLHEAGVPEHIAEQNAWWMVEQLTHKNEAQLLAQDDIWWQDEYEVTLQHWLEQLIQEKKPLQYILGTVPFVDLTIFVEPPTLIPRPETEEIVVWLLDQLKPHAHESLAILDLCTGSGCIALALAAALPNAQVTGTDISEHALRLAEKNKQYNAVGNVTFMRADLYDGLPADATYDVIISNPPYLSEDSYQHVTDQIRLWEDKRALVAEKDGMALYGRIIAGASARLKKRSLSHVAPLPRLIMEIGKDQGDIELLIRDAGFTTVKVYDDMAGLRRWVVGWI